MSNNKETGGISFSGKQWVVSFNRKRITYSVERYGVMAETLASNTLSKLRDGNYDELRDNVLIRLTHNDKSAAKILGISEGELYIWLSTGVINGKEVCPPKREKLNSFRFCGFELSQALERINGNPPENF